MILAVYGKGGSGKTTVATHLAKTFSDKGKFTLLLSLETRFGSIQRALGIQIEEKKSLVNAILDASNPMYYQEYEENLMVLSMSDNDTVSQSDVISNILQNEEILPRFTKDIMENFDVIIVDGTEKLIDPINYHFLSSSDKILHVVDARPEGLAYYNAHQKIRLLEKEFLIVNKVEESIINPSTISSIIGKKADIYIPFEMDIIRSSYHVRMSKHLLKKSEQIYNTLMGIEETRKSIFPWKGKRS